MIEFESIQFYEQRYRHKHDKLYVLKNGLRDI